jgi:hypothetical protein
LQRSSTPNKIVHAINSTKSDAADLMGRFDKVYENAKPVHSNDSVIQVRELIRPKSRDSSPHKRVGSAMRANIGLSSKMKSR